MIQLPKFCFTLRVAVDRGSSVGRFHNHLTGVTILPIQRNAIYKGNPSKSPYIYGFFDSPPKWVPFHDPCSWFAIITYLKKLWKNGKTRDITKGLATCQFLGARFSHVTFGAYGGPRCFPNYKNPTEELPKVRCFFFQLFPTAQGGTHEPKRRWRPKHLYGYGGFLKCWYPTTMGFPTKHDHFGVFLGVPPFKETPLWI